MATAKIIFDGNTQMVRLPIGYRFDCDEVEVRKVGSEIRLAPKSDKGSELLAILAGFSDDFSSIVEEAHNNIIPSKREEL